MKTFDIFELAKIFGLLQHMPTVCLHALHNTLTHTCTNQIVVECQYKDKMPMGRRQSLSIDARSHALCMLSSRHDRLPKYLGYLHFHITTMPLNQCKREASLVILLLHQDNFICNQTLRNQWIIAWALQGESRTVAGVNVSDQTIQTFYQLQTSDLDIQWFV